MNETGSWPDQPWLWLYPMWYQVPPMNSSGNADILVLVIMVVLSPALLVVPFIPGLGSIPRLVPVHRGIWRRYNTSTGLSRGQRRLDIGGSWQRLSPTWRIWTEAPGLAAPTPQAWTDWRVLAEMPWELHLDVRAAPADNR